MLVRHMQDGKCTLVYIIGGPDDEREPKVVAGDPEQCRALTEAADGQFYSCALSYYPGEATEEQIIADCLSYLRVLLPGMEPGLDYAFVVVIHDETVEERHDAKRLAGHIYVPKLHLGTGKRLTPFLPKLDFRRMECWQEVTNKERGYLPFHELAGSVRSPPCRVRRSLLFRLTGRGTLPFRTRGIGSR